MIYNYVHYVIIVDCINYFLQKLIILFLHEIITEELNVYKYKMY